MTSLACPLVLSDKTSYLNTRTSPILGLNNVDDLVHSGKGGFPFWRMSSTDSSVIVRETLWHDDHARWHVGVTLSLHRPRLICVTYRFSTSATCLVLVRMHCACDLTLGGLWRRRRQLLRSVSMLSLSREPEWVALRVVGGLIITRGTRHPFDDMFTNVCIFIERTFWSECSAHPRHFTETVVIIISLCSQATVVRAWKRNTRAVIASWCWSHCSVLIVPSEWALKFVEFSNGDAAERYVWWAGKWKKSLKYVVIFEYTVTVGYGSDVLYPLQHDCGTAKEEKQMRYCGSDLSLQALETN